MVIFSLSSIVQKPIFSSGCRNFWKEPITFYCNFDYRVFPSITFITERCNEIRRTEKTGSCHVLLPEWEDVGRQRATKGTESWVKCQIFAEGWLTFEKPAKMGTMFTVDREEILGTKQTEPWHHALIYLMPGYCQGINQVTSFKSRRKTVLFHKAHS